MSANEFGALVLFVVLLVSAVSYDHRCRRYAAGKRQRIESPRNFAWVYRYLQLSTALFGFAAFFIVHPAVLQVHHEPSLVIAGSLVALAGLGLFVVAKRTLGTQYSPCFDSYIPNAVVQKGVYCFIRHPIYTGNLVIGGGLTVATGSLWIALNLVLLAIYYVGSARKEEAALTGQFAEYRSYLERSGRFLPRLRSAAYIR